MKNQQTKLKTMAAWMLCILGLLIAVPVNAQVELVDLGLSVKWADRNIDATAPSATGGYYAWGETITKDTYSWATYTHCSGTAATCVDIGADISRNTSYDRAYKYNSTMWLPTAEQWEELISQCTWKETTVSGVKGYNVKGPNGNSIFLPFSGCSYDGSNHGVGSNAYYWTANNVPSDNSKAQAAYIKSGTKTTVTNINRRTGVAIRAVGDLTTPELVDLGLSVRWADRNIDAATSHERGGYYAWGETSTKDTYTWATYSYCEGTASSCVIIGSDIRKSMKYDRAYIYSNLLCLPTVEQWNELKSKCTWTETTVSGVKGYKVKGPSGKTIFLPFSGCSYDGSDHGVGSNAYYWTSNYVMGETSKANAAYIKSGTTTSVNTINRRTGVAIRAVEVKAEANSNWYLVTDSHEFFEMSRVGMLVATDDDMLFTVLDVNGGILADNVLRVHFVTGDPTPVKEITVNEQSDDMLRHYVNNRLTLIGASGTVEIYSISGVKVITAMASTGETNIDVSSLSPGIYIVKCGQQSFKFNKK